MAELTLNEKRLLAALEKTGTKTVDVPQVAVAMDANQEAVVQWAHLAMDNGLVKLERVVEKSYAYTEEGSVYRAAGLPETQLLAAIGDAGITLAELQKHPAFKIGFGQLRKKGLVAVAGTQVTKSPGASTADDEVALADPKKAGEKAKDLVKRKLLSETETVRYMVALTPDGVKTSAAGFNLTEEIGTLTRDQILSGAWKNASLRRYDIHKLPKTVYPGKSHPYQRLIDEMRQILLEMGFTEMHGGIVQSAFWNFDALFQPQDQDRKSVV
jgi:phenylalanyl-tRNA synthetase alpha chain